MRSNMIPADKKTLTTTELRKIGLSLYHVNNMVKQGQLIKLNIEETKEVITNYLRRPDRGY